MTGLQKRNDYGKMVLKSGNRCIPYSVSCNKEDQKESDNLKNEKEG